MGNLLEVKDVYKTLDYKKILKGISFNLEKGKVLGIMGPNGSGKTTLLNTIFGFFRAERGEILIDGLNPGVESKKIVSYLLDKSIFPSWMKISDGINYYKDFFPDFNIEKMNGLLKVMNLEEEMLIKSLSKGMNEKFALSLALSRKAKLYMLDEPISGVDPVTRDKILDAIIDSLDEESSLIITTHYIGELERIFDEALFIGDGKVVESGKAEELRIKHNCSIDELYRKLFS